jgi:hypothetical protein
MIVLDGFCSGKELCRAGLSFTLLLYGIGAVLTAVGVMIARLLFRVLDVVPATRLRVMKVLLLIPLIPGILVLGLLLGGIFGRL